MAEALPKAFPRTENGIAASADAAQLPSHRKLIPGLLVAAALVVLPMCFLGNISGHDLLFHLSSWMEVARQWREGILYPRWAMWANFGFGEPRFIFYPPVSWLAGAALGCLLPWRMVPGALIWLTLIFAGLAFFPLSRRCLPSPQAELAAIFFAVNPYHLLIVYYRSDFAELIASALFPLLVLGVVELAQGKTGAIFRTSWVLALIWLSNAPIAVLASYSFVLFLIVACVALKSTKPVLPAAESFVLGVGLACFYIVPAAYEQRWVNIDQALVEPLRIANNFLFTRTNEPEYLWFNWKASAVMLTMIGAICIAAVFARLFFTKSRDANQPESRTRGFRLLVWRMLLALAAVAIFMVFPISRFVWAHAPKLRFIQFPWRWMALAGVPCALFLGAATLRARRKGLVWVALWLALAGIATLMIYDGPWDSDDVTDLTTAFYSNHGYDGSDEYSTIGSDRYDLAPNAPLATVLDEEGNPAPAEDQPRISVQTWLPERRVISVQADAPVTIAPKLVNYPAWKAIVNGRPAPIQSVENTAQMKIQLLAGSGRIEIRFTRTWDRLLGLLISLLSLALLVIGMLRSKQSQVGAS